jgi:diguanylate cyclase (GGDEF)-like protein
MNLATLALGLLVVALALALAFHRNRAAQILFVLLVMCAALAANDARLTEGALRLGAPLLLVAALLPEPRLLSRRNGVYLLASLLTIALVWHAPTHVFEGLMRAGRWLAAGTQAQIGAALFAALAAAVCLTRWTLSAQPMEFGLVLSLLCAAAGFLRVPHAQDMGWLAAAGAVGVLGVLYASYRMAFVDALSGLPNRRALDETLMRLTGHFAVAMIDIDHFKQFNDTYGHAAGDVVLRTVAKLLRRHAGGTAFRYGGEEFCVVFEGARVAKAADHCEAARAAVQAERIAVPAKGKRGLAGKVALTQVAVTISIGTAAREAERRGPHEVLKAADQALYKAKAKGRNRVVSA